MKRLNHAKELFRPMYCVSNFNWNEWVMISDHFILQQVYIYFFLIYLEGLWCSSAAHFQLLPFFLFPSLVVLSPASSEITSSGFAQFPHKCNRSPQNLTVRCKITGLPLWGLVCSSAQARLRLGEGPGQDDGYSHLFLQVCPHKRNVSICHSPCRGCLGIKHVGLWQPNPIFPLP